MPVFKNKYERLKYDLEINKIGTMKCFGTSMLPLLPSTSLCEYIVQEEYNVGDIVFCKVRGKWIDSHLITRKSFQKNRIIYLISNNHGHDNGWTHIIYGKVIKSTDKHGNEKYFK